MDVEGGEVVERPFALVLVLDAHEAGPPRRKARMAATARLDGGLLIARDDELVVEELPLAIDPLVEVEDDAGLLRELRVAGEDPGPVPPGTDHGVVKDASHRRGAERVGDPRSDDLRRDLR